jgi:hypothetical protein
MTKRLMARFTQAALLALTSALLVLGGCDGGIPSSERGKTISEERFIDTVVELRKAALRREDGRPSPMQRERILAERNVTAEDLRRFAEIHGRNVPFMHDVWAEVDRRLRELEQQEQEDPDAEGPPEGEGAPPPRLR